MALPCQDTSRRTVASLHAPNPTTVAFHSHKATPLDYPSLRAQWMDWITDLVSGVPPKVPPFHQINHEINLVDPDKRINYRLPKCPDALKEELAEKISRYTSAGWWVPAMVCQAIPMLCVLKKNGKLQTVFDLHQQNDNTEKDVSPFPDQDTIRHDVARAPFRSKLDMSEA